MPPCAAPVWDRVGYSLVSTAVRARLPDSRAARIPAPPAPTITTSYVWNCMVCPSADARVEGEDHEGAHEQHQQGGGVQQHLEPEASGVPLRIVVDDRAQAVGPVQLGQPQHGE